ncbi:MAG TPA: hypothetical protein VGM59_18185 [Dongiaceae bacterium]
MQNGKSAGGSSAATTPGTGSLGAIIPGAVIPGSQTRQYGRGIPLLFACAALALLAAQPPAMAANGKTRLASDLELSTVGFFQAQDLIPKNDKPRTAKCLAQAMVMDIPEPDAAKLADVYEKRAKADNALAQKWLTVTKKDAPARNAQVMTQVKKICPDLGPYLERVL